MRIAVLSTGRQDWGILRGICLKLRDDPAFELQLLLGGSHNSEWFGETAKLVESEGIVPAAKLKWVPPNPPMLADEQAADALRLVAKALQRLAPDAMLIAGDRFETAAAALAATIERIPIIHLHGGEETLGAIDNALRHAISKLSHLHFTSHPEHTARVIALGEDPVTVHTVGAPGLENLHRNDLPSRAELEHFLGLELRTPVVLVSMHPATLGGNPVEEATAVVEAMDAIDATYLIMLPNADPGSDLLRSAFINAARPPRRKAVEALGERRFWGAMRLADAMLGNSSSAIIEAPAIGLPAVNVGDRQGRRVRGGNLIDAPVDSALIAAALRQALEPDFHAAAKVAPCPFGNGDSSLRMIEILRQWKPPVPPFKRMVPV